MSQLFFRIMCALGLSVFITLPALAQRSRPAPRSSIRSGAASKTFIVPNVEFEIVPKKGFDLRCPVLVQVTEQKDDPEHGMLIIEGDAPLKWLAEGFQLYSFNKERAEWRSRLSSPYHNCVAEGHVRNPKTLVQNHLRLDFSEGMVSLVLDVEKLAGSAKILEASATASGRPFWRWEVSEKSWP